MTRDEARQQLEGTWNFEVSGSHVYVQDQEILAELSLMAAESAGQGKSRQRYGRSVSAGYTSSWSAPHTPAGKQLFN